MRTDADPHGPAGRCSERCVHPRSAVDAGSDLDVVGGIEQGREFLWFEAGEVEADDAEPAVSALWALEDDAGDFRKTAEQARAEFLLSGE